MTSLMLKNVMSSVAALTFFASATGCVVYPEKQDFGDSVRHVTAIQVARPHMVAAPQDGQRAMKVLQAYRQDVATPQEIRNDIVINVGQ